MEIPGVIKFKVDGVWKSVVMVEGPPGPPGPASFEIQLLTLAEYQAIETKSNSVLYAILNEAENVSKLFIGNHQIVLE